MAAGHQECKHANSKNLHPNGRCVARCHILKRSTDRHLDAGAYNEAITTGQFQYSRAVVDQDVEAAHLLDGLLHARLHLVNLEQVGDDAVPLRSVE